jgi:hypothetical protein
MRFIGIITFVISTIAYSPSVVAFVRQSLVSTHLQQTRRMSTHSSAMAATKDELLAAQAMVDKLLAEKACGRYNRNEFVTSRSGRY